MRKFLPGFLCFFPVAVYSQFLQVPTRNLADPNGDQFVAMIENMNLTDRENTIFDAVLHGNVPDFLRTLVPVQDSMWNGSTYNHVLYYVLPDYLAIGDNSNYYLCPMTPILAQKLADTLHCILPTRKMVNRIWATAPLHLNPQTIPPSPQMTTVPVMAHHDSIVWSQRQPLLVSYPLGTLTGGDKKDVILSNEIYAYPPPDRVVIYGWHYTNGTPIQPMYAGHESTYADYSHGIRLVQNLVWVDGTPATATSILTSASLNGLLSDEGTIDPPRYPIGTTVSIPPKPVSFCLLNESATEIRVKIKPDASILFYHVYLSTDGVNFSAPITQTSSEFVLSGLSAETVYYIRLTATNAAGESPVSEVLAAVPSVAASRLLLVNGYDRPKATNTFDFVRYHAPAILAYGIGLDGATNEALTDSLVNWHNYEMTDYLLGEESTVNETFSTTEQALVQSYLDQGGKLFVSGAEIGWDLHHLGNATDSIFYKEYLKAGYVYDTPNNQPGTYYGFDPVSGSIFNGMDSMFYDDGSAGIYDVVYPDVITPINGGISSAIYTGLTNQFATINFHGIFPHGLISGKLVYMAFPFETITSSGNRDTVMSRILDYFTYVPSTASIDQEGNPSVRVFPNPVEDILNIQLNPAESGMAKVVVWNGLGQAVLTKVAPVSSLQVDMSSLPAGIYILSVETACSSSRIRIVKN